MKRAELQAFLRSRYDRPRWLTLLREVLPTTELWRGEQPRDLNNASVKSAAQIARIPLADGKVVAVIEVKVSGQIDLQKNRVGLRNLIAKFIDQQHAHAVLGFFLGDGDDYRFSFVARTSEIGTDGQLSRSETAPRRYTYLLGPGQACRTPVERLEALAAHKTATLDDLVSAFRVEPLFKEFFRDYGRVFGEVEALIAPSIKPKETLRLFTQRLFNRLMFLAFVERKKWLKMGSRTDYLVAVWDDYAAKKRASRQANFYQDRLLPLFFEALNDADRKQDGADPRFGVVPYLNGGLFERSEDGSDGNPEIVVPDEAIAAIIDSESGLFSRYNFTVAESTPLEIDVAVDPEMLGKVFEELVTGRHEQGSYYTPKPITAFMARVALAEYLASSCPKESRAAIDAFVHDHAPSDIRDPELVLSALKEVTVCDPACGSGAYLLSMLHELLDLRVCLFNVVRKPSASTSHERKLAIIERNLYGVDIDPFAINIARLRLWLSLVVDFEGDQPPPLPNLDFKIERGNALSSRAPADVVRDDGNMIAPTVREFQEKKAQFLRSHGKTKARLRAEIDKLKATLMSWLSTEGPADSFHWAVEFGEVFLPTPASTTLSGSLNLGGELAAPPEPGGFDIVVANPPYVRMELIKPQKPILKKRFPEVHGERADLYIYFYARAHELLRPGGVSAFISSNKWLRAGYGEPLRTQLLDSQAFKLVMDFGELPVFESAAADAAIFIWQKKPRETTPTQWAMVKDLNRCYEQGVRAHFLDLKKEVPATQFGPGKPRLATSEVADLRARMERSGPPLRDLVNNILGMGIKTGLNDAFIIDQAVRDKLIDETPNAVEIIKPLLSGDDVRRYEIHYRQSFLIYAYHGLEISRYPSVAKHLKKFRSYKNAAGDTIGLDHRATEQEWYELQQPQMAYRPTIEGSKIYHPEIGKECRFMMDEQGYFPNKTVFFVPSSDWYVLGVLNSAASYNYLKAVCALLGDEDEGGRLLFSSQHLGNLPIPEAPSRDRTTIGRLAQESQSLHFQRRRRVERFLSDLGIPLTDCTSRNPLEYPWALTAGEFSKRAKKQPLRLYETAHGETRALTERIATIEAEIDQRISALYGLELAEQQA